MSKPKFNSAAWEDGEYIITINGKPIGATIARKSASDCLRFIESAYDEITAELQAEVEGKDKRIDELSLKIDGLIYLESDLATAKGLLEDATEYMAHSPICRNHEDCDCDYVKTKTDIDAFLVGKGER